MMPSEESANKETLSLISSASWVRVPAPVGGCGTLAAVEVTVTRGEEVATEYDVTKVVGVTKETETTEEG